MSRERIAFNITRTVAAADANNVSTSVDLGENPGLQSDPIDYEISIPATPDLVDDKTITLTIEDSADDSSFTAVPQLTTLVVTGAGGTGAAAASRKLKLPPNVRRYIHLKTATEAAGGDNTGITASLKGLF